MKLLNGRRLCLLVCFQYTQTSPNRRARCSPPHHYQGDWKTLGDSDFVLDTLDASKEQFERKFRFKSRGFTLSMLSKRVSELLGVAPECIYESGKYPQNVKARSLFCHWAVRELGLTQPAVSISVKRGQAIADENGFQLLDE